MALITARPISVPAPGRRDHGVARAAGDDRTRVEGRAQRLRDGQRFAGDGRLVHLEPVAAGQTEVGGHSIPSAEPHQVATDQPLGADPPDLAISQHGGHRGHQPAQAAARTLGPPLLEVAQRRVGQRDRDDDRRVEPLADRERDRGGEPEQGHHRIRELPPHQLETRGRRRLGHPIRSVSAQPALGFTRRQSLLSGDLELGPRSAAHFPDTMTAVRRRPARC